MQMDGQKGEKKEGGRQKLNGVRGGVAEWAGHWPVVTIH